MNYLGQQLTKKVESISQYDFTTLALEIFHYQAAHNPLYAQYLQLLGIHTSAVAQLDEVPFLPIQFFKNYAIQTGADWQPEVIFTSSGTTGQTRSRHLVPDLDFYRRNARRGFAHFYGNVSDYCILALLPSYLERTGSSLVAMAHDFIQQSRYPQSGFFLHDHEKLVQTLQECKRQQIPTILLGVSFALWDLANAYEIDLEEIIIMETGGFKGRSEILREELHAFLGQRFQVSAIHSEYGMTELLSQAYSLGQGVFRCAPTLQVRTRQITDPLSAEKPDKTGLIAVIDLANVASVSFILTEDLGRVAADGHFQVLGRAQNSDARGCTLLLLNE